MAAAATAARAAAAAAARVWLAGYELRVAREQAWALGGLGPREGADDAGTLRLVQELAEHGVPQVLSLPDGAVCGRRGLAPLAARAETAARRAAAGAAARALAAARARTRGVGDDDSASALLEAAAAATSLNTVAERLPGAAEQQRAKGASSEDAELEAAVAAALAAADVTHGPARAPAERALREALALEAAAWAELDAAAALLLRARGQRSSLPYGLLQLRPPPGGELAWTAAVAAPVAAAAATEAAGAAEAESSSDHHQQPYNNQPGAGSTATPRVPYAYAASDGLDTHADPLMPHLRRAGRLSFALASLMDVDRGEGVQALLEHPSTAGRLRACVAQLMRRRKRLAAMAAVAGVARPRPPPPPPFGGFGTRGGGE